MNKLWDKFGDWFGDMNPMKVTILFVLESKVQLFDI